MTTEEKIKYIRSRVSNLLNDNETSMRELDELKNNIAGLCEHFGAQGIVDLGVKLLRLERERDAERALADSLGNAIFRYLSYAHNDYSEMTKAMEAWKEARNDN